MENIGWGLWMTLAGMGTVFLLLALLMGLLVLIGTLDRPRRAVAPVPERAALAAPAPGRAALAAPAPPAPEPDRGLEILHDGLTRDQVAAIAVAVSTHLRVRRAQAAPAMRTHQPGSHLYASRWVSAGRAHQIQNWRRS